MSAAPQMDGKNWTLLIILSAIWAGSFILAELALEELGPLSIMTARVTIGALGLYAMMRATGVRIPSSERVKTGTLLGFFFILGLMNNVVPFSLLVWGQTHLSASLASILNATMPLFTVFFAHYFTADEKLTAAKLVGVTLGIVGVGVIVGENGIDFMAGSTLAKFAVMGTACSYAIAALIARRFAVLEVPPLVVAFGQSAAAAVIAIPLVSVIEAPWGHTISATTWASLVALGLLCSSVAYAIYFQLIAKVGATNASLVTLVVPPLAIISGILLLGEHLSGHQMAGMALILLALAVVDGRLKLPKPAKAQ